MNRFFYSILAVHPPAPSKGGDNFVCSSKGGDNFVCSSKGGDNFVCSSKGGDNFVCSSKGGDFSLREKLLAHVFPPLEKAPHLSPPLEGAGGWTLVLLACILFSCNHEKESLQDYYYPINEIAEGMVYEYQSPLQDSVQHPPHYWYYRVVKGEDGTESFVGVYYNHNFDIEQLVRESVVNNGVKTDDVRLYEYDDAGQRFDIRAEVKQNTTFFFEADETQILPYQLAWRSKIDPDASTILTRGRAFRGFVSCEFNGEKQRCAKFQLDDIIEADHDTEGGQQFELTATELYAKGIGLIYSKKILPNGMEIIYDLKDRYPMSELEAKAEKKMNGN